MAVYYNEFDPKAAAWLRELIKAGLLPSGDVDERSIVDVRGCDLAGYDQCHFFSGIGGWPYALQLAGWGDRPVWTASLPCQPFSAAGKQQGAEDERHLWPVFRELVAKCSPDRIFGEQVANSIGFGWIDGVRADLEAQTYALGIAVLGAHSLGSPHIRQRLYWVAESECRSTERHGHEMAATNSSMQRKARQQRVRDESGYGSAAIRLGNSDITRPQGRRQHAGEHADKCAVGTAGAIGGVGHAQGSDWEIPVFQRRSQQDRFESRGSGGVGYWSDFDILHCTDGKARRVESGTFPLAHGIPARVGRLRGYGNAVVPQVAAEFIRAFLEV